MIISEILNSKTKYEVVTATATTFVAEATVGKRVIRVRIAEQNSGTWELQFTEEKEWGHTFNATGSGNAFQVMSLVFGQVMIHFIEQYQPNKIFVVGEKGTRSNIYMSMLKKTCPKDYTIEHRPFTSTADKITLKRKPDAAE